MGALANKDSSALVGSQLLSQLITEMPAQRASAALGCPHRWPCDGASRPDCGNCHLSPAEPPLRSSAAGPRMVATWRRDSGIALIGTATQPMASRIGRPQKCPVMGPCTERLSRLNLNIRYGLFTWRSLSDPALAKAAGKSPKTIRNDHFGPVALRGAPGMGALQHGGTGPVAEARNNRSGLRRHVRSRTE
jgi:hypothetical protein